MSKKLYGHYTNQKGMMSIVSSETLWATNIKYLNDAHEFQHAIDLITELIASLVFNQEKSLYKQFLEYTSAITEKIKTLDDSRSSSVFTISFTEETDLLSQWRGYCSDNNGFCLKIDVDGVYRSARKSFPSANLLNCVYDEAQKRSVIQKLMDKHWYRFAELKLAKHKDKVISELATEVVILASYFKHPSFSEEKEMRIVIFLEDASHTSLNFREGQFSIVPYIELPASRKLIDEIIIGPCSNKKLSKRSLIAFLDNNFGANTNPDVGYSSTPYRSW